MNETLNAINETLKHFASNFICFHVDRGREVNVVESLLDVENKLEELERIDRKLCAIWTQLEKIANALDRIATTYSDAEKKWGNLTSLTIRTDPSDGPFCSQEPEEPEGFADIA